MTTLSELLRLQEEATPGPWHQSAIHHLRVYDSHAEEVATAYIDRPATERDANAKFIAAARNFDLKGLQTQYEAMREWIYRAEHSQGCRFWSLSNGGSDNCTCGLSALKTSLDTKARGDG